MFGHRTRKTPIVIATVRQGPSSTMMSSLRVRANRDTQFDQPMGQRLGTHPCTLESCG